MELKQRLFALAQNCLNKSEFDALQREVNSPLGGMRWTLMLASTVAGGAGLVD